MPKISIRLAAREDAPYIIRHRREMFAEMSSGTPQGRAQMDAHFDIWLRRHLEIEDYIAWIACDDGEVIAGAGLWLIDWLPAPDGFAGRLPYVCNVYTEPDYRHQGLAQKLMNCVIEYCQQKGYPRVRLHASEFGRPLYEKLGFNQTNEMALIVPNSNGKPI
jgi:GNAT superfamily N-acetyltransferase